MKFAVISNIERAKEILDECRRVNIVPFIFDHADPDHELVNEKFLYVGSDNEINEKVRLLKADFTIKAGLRF